MRLWGLLVWASTYAIGWGYPAFRSFEALESKGRLDDSQWLTYWVLLAIYSFLEAILWRVLKVLPFYPELKLAVLAWLTLPQTNGATFIYFKSRPYILKAVAFVRTQTNYMTGQTDAVSAKSISSVDGQVLEDLHDRVAAYESTIEAALAADYAAVASGKIEPMSLSSKLDALEASLNKNSLAIKPSDPPAAVPSVSHPSVPTIPVSDASPTNKFLNSGVGEAELA